VPEASASEQTEVRSTRFSKGPQAFRMNWSQFKSLKVCRLHCSSEMMGPPGLLEGA